MNAIRESEHDLAQQEGVNLEPDQPCRHGLRGHCGELCHSVMTPEFTAWSESPHAKVKCVECHVGPGAAWYVKAKIPGKKQLYAILSKTYPETIEAPIDNLRPASETCEHCHWPDKFAVARPKIFYHYASDEDNTLQKIDMLLHIGGSPLAATSDGIHWHIGSEISFIARDQKRSEIPSFYAKMYPQRAQAKATAITAAVRHLSLKSESCR